MAAGVARALGELAVPCRRRDRRALVAARPGCDSCPAAARRHGLATVADWKAAVAAAGVDYTRIWWDARPHPRLGTLEIRILDQATSVERAAALVALVQALCAAAAGARAGAPRRRRARPRASSAPGSSSRGCGSPPRPCASSRSAVGTGSRRSPPTLCDARRHEEPPRRSLSAPPRRRAAGPPQRARRPRRARDRSRRRRRHRRPRGSARRAGPRRRAGGGADPGRPALGPRGLVRPPGAG